MPGVVGHRQLPGRGRSARALITAFSSKVARLVDARVVTRDVHAGAEDELHLLDLVGVAGSQQHP